ncbi:hypothetical protein COHA_000286 [Chlorella ohadii]|uniref:Uncharacterized protein n=1 Tax=Chlorella ohadii TaxID=2649997 RepID=A0AAD5H6X8_9CHLO|nr:hypothetical protein COHA_000286 [Chlorella ohadii]
MPPAQKVKAVTPEVLLPENNTILNPWAPLFNALLTALFMFWGSRLESQLKQLREEMQAMRRGLEAQSRSLNHLGSFTKIKVSSFPRDLLDPLQSRCGSLPVGSMPKSLTMPKHRIPSFSSLLSPKITNTPSKKATVAAASDELRLECCIISRTGRDHQRKGQMCEAISAEEGCTATAVLMWRDGQGDVCLQAANVGGLSGFFTGPAIGPPRQLVAVDKGRTAV